ncbi:MAG: PhnD/SsuA/transferrin family substrate-binding protein [Aliarcobacter sp.]|nr:PhnD/SsuA/transferrin family substrate-binding protein [Aliarcobacter sp.]
MKIFRNFVLLIFLVSSLYSENKDYFSFGLSISDYSIDDQNRIKNLSLGLLKKLNEENPIDINITFYENEEKLLEDFKNKKNINTLILSTQFYYDNRELIKKISKKPYIYRANESKNSQLLMIANKKSKITSINDIKDKLFANSLYMRNNSAWLDYMTLKKIKKTYTQLIKEESLSTKASTALLDVYFNKADFCIIDKDMYEDMLILNPSLKKNLTIIEKSDEIFFFAFTAVHNDVSDESLIVLDDFFTNKEFKSSFREFFKLISLNSITAIEFKDFDKIEQFYSEYQNLKKKYP